MLWLGLAVMTEGEEVEPKYLEYSLLLIALVVKAVRVNAGGELAVILVGENAG